MYFIGKLDVLDLSSDVLIHLRIEAKKKKKKGCFVKTIRPDQLDISNWFIDNLLTI